MSFLEVASVGFKIVLEESHEFILAFVRKHFAVNAHEELAVRGGESEAFALFGYLSLLYLLLRKLS